MDSPFIDVNSVQNEVEGSQLVFQELPERTPFIDIGLIDKLAEDERLVEDDYALDQWLPSGLTKRQVGDATLSIADSAISESGEYKVAGCDNSLLVINDPKQRVSENFLVGEFTQAQSGAYKWKFARIDPSLVDNLQRARSFIDKSISILDGYYTPKYLKDVLKITDPARISRDPHICGKGVKISLKGYEKSMREIAVAIIVSCKNDIANINIGIGRSTLTFYVKQPYNYEKQITSYIKNEESKWPEIKFCKDFIRIFIDSARDYELELQSATAILARSILTEYYTKKWKDDWKPAIHNVISIMFGKSESKNPSVILFALAYSSFGCLYRHYLKDKAKGTRTVERLIHMLRPNDSGSGKGPGSFFWAIDQWDKTEFIKICYTYMSVKTPGETASVFKTFFDWQHDQNDKDFLDALKVEIDLINKKFGYTETVPQAYPQEGSKHDLTVSDPNPDKPVHDVTGRYWYDAPATDANFYGLFLLINQAGNYISGKIGHVFKKYLKGRQTYKYGKKPIGKLKDSVELFYGKMETDGTIKGFIYPQKIIYIKKNSGDESLNVQLEDHDAGIKYEWEFKKRNSDPVISARIVDFYIKANPVNEDLTITLAWAYPLPGQLQKFKEFLADSDKEVLQAIKNFYSPTSDIPNVRKNEMENAVRKLDNSHNFYQLVNYQQFVAYFTNYFYSRSESWQPRNDKDPRAKSEWIKKMLRDYRDQPDTAVIIGRDFKGVYDFFGVDTRIPANGYKYKINIITNTAGFGPFARTGGKIIIENITNYKAYPKAESWKKGSKTEYPIGLWQASISLDKWRPKIASRFEAEAETAETSVFYEPSDFSDATVDMQEWTAYEFSAGKDVGDQRIEVSGGYTKRLVTIAGPGKGKLEFEKLEDTPYIPDTITVKPKENDDDKIFDFSTPGVTFFKGYIGTKAITDIIASEPLADKFTTAYQLTSFTYFKHDHAPLLNDAIYAVGRMCAEELTALSDPNSVLEVKGHADASGEAEYNKKLSLARAKNVLQAIKDRLGVKLRAGIKPVEGLGEAEANQLGQFKEKNAWRRRVFVIINGNAVLMLGQ